MRFERFTKHYLSIGGGIGLMGLFFWRDVYWRDLCREKELDFQLLEKDKRKMLQQEFKRREKNLMKKWEEHLHEVNLHCAYVQTQLLESEDTLQETTALLEKKENLISSTVGGSIIPEECKHITKYGLPSTENLKFREGYVSAYDRRNRTALWSLEHLTRSNVANSAERVHSKFQEDASVPEEFRARLEDYYRSGFDRGHLVPAGNVKFSQKAMNETFILSNISPQVGNGFNRHYWARLEQFCRTLLESYEDVYICTGPLYIPTINEEDEKYYVKYQMIGNPPNVAVPTHFYKTVLVANPREDSDDSSPVRIASFILPNDRIDRTLPLERFIVPLRALKIFSGLDFWNQVEDPKPLCVREGMCSLPPPDWWSVSKEPDFPIKETIETFLVSKEESYSFPPTLSAKQRKEIHNLAEEHQLLHVTSGEGNDRHVEITKANEAHEIINAKE